MDKCIVMGCANHQGEGRFVGELCAPCHTMLTQGKKMPSDAWFAKQWVGLTDDEFDAINPKLALFQFYKAIEAKLKEKNGG